MDSRLRGNDDNPLIFLAFLIRSNKRMGQKKNFNSYRGYSQKSGLFHFVWKATVYKGAIIPVKTLRSAPCKKPFFAKPWA